MASPADRTGRRGVRRAAAHAAAFAIVFVSVAGSMSTVGAPVAAAGAIGHAIRGTVTARVAAAPLAGAQLTVCREDLDGVPGEWDASCAIAITASDGTYVVAALADGDYEVRASAPGTTSLASGYYAVGAPGHHAADESRDTPVTVAAADAVGIDITLPDGHAIRGTITGADPGAPLLGAAVTACPPDEDPCAAATTGAGGRYAITGLADRTYTIRVWLADPEVYASGSYAADAPGGYAVEPADATPVRLSGADIGGIDVTLPR